MYSWCINDVFMMYSWCINDVFMMYSWCIHDVFTKYSRCIHNVFKMYSWLSFRFDGCLYRWLKSVTILQDGPVQLIRVVRRRHSLRTWHPQHNSTHLIKFIKARTMYFPGRGPSWHFELCQDAIKAKADKTALREKSQQCLAEVAVQHILRQSKWNGVDMALSVGRYWSRWAKNASQFVQPDSQFHRILALVTPLIIRFT